MTVSAMLAQAPSVDVNAFCVGEIPTTAPDRSGVATRMMNAVIEHTKNVSEVDAERLHETLLDRVRDSGRGTSVRC